MTYFILKLEYCPLLSYIMLHAELLCMDCFVSYERYGSNRQLPHNTNINVQLRFFFKGLYIIIWHFN